MEIVFRQDAVKETPVAMVSQLPRPVSVSPVSAEEVEATRQPTERARTLPGRVYHDPAIFAWEHGQWFRREWLFVGREEDAPETGSFFRCNIAGENAVVVRGNDGVLRAFYNVCRHRGATVVEEASGRMVRFQCPYHAWIYDLEGNLRPPRHTETLEEFSCAAYSLLPIRCETWNGFVFLNLDNDAAAARGSPGRVPGPLRIAFHSASLRRAKRMEYDVRANWKALMENYAECYHCPGVHPLLNHMTPYNLGGYLPGAGEWAGSWMELTGEFETLSIDGYDARSIGDSGDDGRRSQARLLRLDLAEPALQPPPGLPDDASGLATGR